jgi:hypothetical protein
MGLSYSPVSVTMLGQAESGREGAASASLSLTDVLGVAIGTGIGGAAVALAHARGWSDSIGVQLACLGPLLGAIVGAIAAHRLPRQVPTKPTDTAISETQRSKNASASSTAPTS